MSYMTNFKNFIGFALVFARAMSVQAQDGSDNRACAADWLFRPSRWRLTTLPFWYDRLALCKLSIDAPSGHWNGLGPT